jgi:hypothetical protein
MFNIITLISALIMIDCPLMAMVGYNFEKFFRQNVSNIIVSTEAI